MIDFWSFAELAFTAISKHCMEMTTEKWFRPKFKNTIHNKFNENSQFFNSVNIFYADEWTEQSKVYKTGDRRKWKTKLKIRTTELKVSELISKYRLF